MQGSQILTTQPREEVQLISEFGCLSRAFVMCCAADVSHCYCRRFLWNPQREACSVSASFCTELDDEGAAWRLLGIILLGVLHKFLSSNSQHVNE